MSGEEIKFKREVLAVALLLFLGSTYILYPFLDAIILAIATSYLLRHAHERLNSRIENNFLSALFISGLIISIITLLAVMLVSNFGHIRGAINFFFFDLQENVSTVLEILNLPETYTSQVQVWMTGVRNSIIQNAASAPGILVKMGIFLVTALYLYRDGDKVTERLMDFAESLSVNEERILKSLIRSTDSIFRGVFATQFTVGGILAVVAAAGFYAIGFLTTPIPFTVLWAILIGIAAILPLVAAFMFYGPIGIYYILIGDPIKGTLILGFGVIFLNVLGEVFLRPYVGSKQMDEHPLIIFLGFLAGPLSMGLKGLILGPLILILFKEFIINYSQLVSEE